MSARFRWDWAETIQKPSSAFLRRGAPHRVSCWEPAAGAVRRGVGARTHCTWLFIPDQRAASAQSSQ